MHKKRGSFWSWKVIYGECRGGGRSRSRSGCANLSVYTSAKCVCVGWLVDAARERVFRLASSLFTLFITLEDSIQSFIIRTNTNTHMQTLYFASFSTPPSAFIHKVPRGGRVEIWNVFWCSCICIGGEFGLRLGFKCVWKWLGILHYASSWQPLKLHVSEKGQNFTTTNT